MNFKQLFTLMTLTLLIITCAKPDDTVEEPRVTDPTSWGEGTMELNGEEITVLFGARQNGVENNVDICHSSYDRYLCFDNIPFQAGTYSLFSRVYPGQDDRSYAYYTNTNGDAVGPEYILDETQADNYFEITAIDEDSQEISGNFNLTFVLHPDWVSPDEPYEPATILLTNGSFRTKILD